MLVVELSKSKTSLQQLYPVRSEEHQAEYLEDHQGIHDQYWQSYSACSGFQDPDVGPFRALFYFETVESGSLRRSGDILRTSHGM